MTKLEYLLTSLIEDYEQNRHKFVGEGGMAWLEKNSFINGWVIDFMQYYDSLYDSVKLGKLGGKVKSEAKTKAARLNGKLGGRPKAIGVSKEANKVQKP